MVGIWSGFLLGTLLFSLLLLVSGRVLLWPSRTNRRRLHWLFWQNSLKTLGTNQSNNFLWKIEVFEYGCISKLRVLRHGSPHTINHQASISRWIPAVVSNRSNSKYLEICFDLDLNKKISKYMLNTLKIKIIVYFKKDGFQFPLNLVLKICDPRNETTQTSPPASRLPVFCQQSHSGRVCCRVP